MLRFTGEVIDFAPLFSVAVNEFRNRLRAFEQIFRQLWRSTGTDIAT
jgi:hypothetical protein